MSIKNTDYIPDIRQMAEMADVFDDMNFRAEMIRDAAISDIEEHGIPDLSGLLWFFYTVIKEFLEDDFENSNLFETEYIKKHIEGNTYDERLELQLTAEDPVFSDIRNNIFLSRLLQDYKDGNGEAKEYIRALLMRYVPDQFKRLKKYKAMNLSTALNDGFLPKLAWEDKWDAFEMLRASALLIVMCQILNIEIDSEMYAITKGMNKSYAKLKEEHKADKVHPFNHEEHMRIFHEVKCYEFGEIFDSRTDINTNKIISYMLSHEYDFAKDSHVGYFSESDLHCDLISLVKAGIRIDELPASELYSLIYIIHIMDDLLLEYETARETLYGLVYEGFDPYPKEKAHLRLAVKPGVNTVPIAKKVMESEKITLNDSDYIKEIERLQAKLRCVENDVIHQRELYETQREENLTLKAENRDMADLRAELKALREFAYNCADDKTTDPKTSREEMLAELSLKSVCIIGGHDNWTNKLKLLFPKWKYAAPQEQGTVPVSILDNTEHVFIFTSHICHSQYGRFIEYIRKNNIPLTYISKVNIDDNIKEFYNAIFPDNH